MSDSIDEGLPNLEIKLGKMIDKLIETDEDLEKNGLNSFYFSDEHCESKYKKLFEKEIPNNSNINNSQITNNIQLNKSICNPQNLALNQINFLQNNPNNLSTIIYSNNPPNNFSNLMIPQQMNNLCNHSSFFSLNNSYMNTTSSFSLNPEKSLDNNMNQNYNKSNIYNNNNIFNNINNINNSFINENENNYFSKKSIIHNNTFNDGNTNIYYNNNQLNSNTSTNLYNYKTSNSNLFHINAELEILLIQVKKILYKYQKIETSIYNKCKGKFEQIIRTHKGSRIFQNYLKNTHYDILHLIFSELKNKLPELLRDNYANYFCKKLFKNLSQKDRGDYLIIIQKYLNILSLDSIATYPIQNIIEELGSKNEKMIFYQGIINSISIFGYHVYGSRVLEKILSYFEEEFQKDIIDYICNNFIDLAYNQNGICLVKKVLSMTHKIELHKKLKEIILKNALNLVVHQYENYAIQTIVEIWDESDLEELLESYKDKYTFLSVKKFSSNVVERILEKSHKNVANYVDEICKDNNLNEILKSKFGNFVLNKALSLSSGKTKEKLLEEIHVNIKFLDDQKIVNKWKFNLIKFTST